MNETDLLKLNTLLNARIERRERQQHHRKFGEEFMKISLERTRLQVAEIMKGPNEKVIESARRLTERRESPETAVSELVTKLESDLAAVKSRTAALKHWRDSL
ncbi:MAG: hypothetical protein QE269_00485 [Fimbriimonas sp.]|nr:hypothetical protein [Fimbriimonas sp.]